MGDMAQWFTENWFNLFSSLGIIGGLWFTAISLHSETKTRRIANLLTITANHREVWKDASAMTAEEMSTLDSYCRQRHIELAGRIGQIEPYH